MNTFQWPQEMVLKPMKEMLVPINTNSTSFSNSNDKNGNGNYSTLDKKISSQKAQVVNCPRCNSTNTKFCYYNNYSLSQPRYICKACKRYWTEGGSFRNIPVGGVSRKNKKTSSKKVPLLVTQQIPSTNTTTATTTSDENSKNQQWQNQDLLKNQTLLHDFKAIYELIQVPNLENKSLELLNGVNLRGCENNSDNSYMFMPMHNEPKSMYSSKKLPSLVPQTPSTNTTTNSDENCKSQQGQNQDLLENQTLVHDFKTIYELIQVPNLENKSLELLNGVSSRGCENISDNSSMSMPIHNEPKSMYSSGYSFFPWPKSGSSLDEVGNGGYEGLQVVEENGDSGIGLFPFEDLKQVSSTNEHNEENNIRDQQDDFSGYWNGVLGEGSW